MRTMIHWVDKVLTGHGFVETSRDYERCWRRGGITATYVQSVLGSDSVEFTTGDVTHDSMFLGTPRELDVMTRLVVEAASLTATDEMRLLGLDVSDAIVKFPNALTGTIVRGESYGRLQDACAFVVELWRTLRAYGDATRPVCTDAERFNWWKLRVTLDWSAAVADVHVSVRRDGCALVLVGGDSQVVDDVSEAREFVKRALG